MSEQTVKCPICGKPYVVQMFYAGDQSACPSCRAIARRDIKHSHQIIKNGGVINGTE